MRTPSVEEHRLDIGQEYHMDALEEIFDSGGFMAGINPRKDDHGDLEYIVLTSSGDTHYSDHVRGDRVRYIGQEHGSGDQPKTGRNGRLIAQNEELTVPIYFFSRETKGEDWEYRGLVDVVEHEYISDDGRMINRFLLERLDIPSSNEYEVIEEEMAEESDDPPLEEDSEETTAGGPRKTRSAIFRHRVKQYYDESCAVCGSSRRTPEGSPEVEAAHIYPRRENGRDHYRNGLALCRLHHWAFDSGWISATDDFEILVRHEEGRDESNEFEHLEGTQLNLPSNEDHQPHPKYLVKHRQLHDFE